MNEDEFYRKRGSVISNFASVESLITKCIVATYFKPGEEEQITAMTEDIFENKFIPFEAKKLMLKTVIKKYHAGSLADFPFNTLNKMQDIRNKLAHGLFQSKAKVVSVNPTKYQIMEYQIRHNAKTYKADDLFNDYDELWKQLDPYLKKLPGVLVFHAEIQE